MNGRDLVRSVRALGAAGAAGGLRSVRAAWRARRADAAALPARGAERARVPGAVLGAAPGPGGGVIRFARSELRVMVAVNGAVFWGWDGAGPEPSHALAGRCPEADTRAVLEPDTDDGWRVVAERATVAVSRTGAVEVRTPGGVTVRRDEPPRWWEPAGGGPARWRLRSEVPADARFFGLGGRRSGPRLRDGRYRLWNCDPARPCAECGEPAHLTMPVQLVVSDAATHLAFHDTSWDGTVTLREGEEGAGSGHDRAGTSELRMSGGPLRCWVMLGTPARVLLAWASLTGAPALPPSWALGHHLAARGVTGEQDVRRLVGRVRELGLPLDAVHLDAAVQHGEHAFTVDQERFPGLSPLAEELGRDGVRLVSVVEPGVATAAGDPLWEEGLAEGVFVTDASGRPVRGEARCGEAAYPDFTHARVRQWWGRGYGARLAQGFAGFRHEGDEPFSALAFGEATLPRSARHELEGARGDHRQGHNVYALGMARAAHEALRELEPERRPLVLARSGWAGSQRYAGVTAGRVADGWPGLRQTLAVVLGLGLCGVPVTGADLDDGPGLSPELFLRRLQLGAYLPLLRTHARVGSGPFRDAGGEVLEHARAVLAERRRLHPYFVTLAHLARRTGAPCVRPVWWSAPEDRALRDCEDAFLLGDSLLVAPVLAPGMDRRAVRLPRGRWYDTATGRAYQGPGQVLVEAPLSRVPVLVRGGAVLPVRGADGELTLEVWAPARGRRGGGRVVPDAGDGWEQPETERYVTRWRGSRVVVEREDEHGVRPPSRPVLLRGAAHA